MNLKGWSMNGGSCWMEGEKCRFFNDAESNGVRTGCTWRWRPVSRHQVTVHI